MRLAISLAVLVLAVLLAPTIASAARILVDAEMAEVGGRMPPPPPETWDCGNMMLCLPYGCQEEYHWLFPERINFSCVTATGGYSQCQVTQVWDPSCGRIVQYQNPDCSGEMVREWRLNAPWQFVSLWDPVLGAKQCGSFN